jgi:aspartyl protease family protein
MGRLILLTLVVAAGILAVYWLASGDSEGSSISGGMVAAVIASAGLLLLNLGWVREAYRGQASKALGQIVIWLAAFVALIGGYTYRYDLQAFGGRIIGAVVPGSAIEEGEGRIVITRSGDDSFILEGRVNDERQRFIFDTGADYVFLTAEAAERIGLRINENDYNVPISTANGLTTAARTRLREVRVGSIAVRDVEAMVAQPGAVRVNLLGMSFLSRLKSYHVSGDRLTLEAQ